MKTGTVTKTDVAVEWLWEFTENGRIYQSRFNQPGARHPVGVEIDGGIARPYGATKSEIEA